MMNRLGLTSKVRLAAPSCHQTNICVGTISDRCIYGKSKETEYRRTEANSSIRKMTPTGNVKTLAGSFTESGYGDGAGSVSRFSGATGVSAFNGMIFVADSGNHRIRAITYDPPPQPISGADINLGLYPGLQITGIVGRTYRVESSPDMNTWSEEAEVLLATSPYLWIDVNGLGAKKFYRALFLP